MTAPGTRCPPGLVLERLTAPTPSVGHALHRVYTPMDQHKEKVLDVALEPLRVLYTQAHISSAGTSNQLARLGLQRRVEAVDRGDMVGWWLTLHNQFSKQGHWYPHKLLFLPRTAHEHRRQHPYTTHPERLSAPDYPQPPPPAPPHEHHREAIPQGSHLIRPPRYYRRGAEQVRA